MTTAYVEDETRQWGLRAIAKFTFDQLVSGTYLGLVNLPVNAIVTKADLVITTLFNSATTDEFSIGDQPTGAAARNTEYSALSADVTAVPTDIPAVPNAYEYANGGTVGVVWTGVGAAPTTGAGTLLVEYVIDGRATEVQR